MGIYFRLLVLACFLIHSPAAKADAELPKSCAAELTSILDHSFRRVSSLESDPVRAEHLLQLLETSRAKIENRVRELCPPSKPCPPSVLIHAVTSSVEETISDLEAPNVKVGWRVWFTVGASVAAYMGTSTAAQTYLDPITATMTVAFLTYFGTSVLDAIGAPVLEYLLPPWRRWMYANNNMAVERALVRNTSQQRHRIIYMLQQELISQTEAYGRTTDTEVILRMLGALSTCTSSPECSAQMKARSDSRAIEIIAKLLAHLVPQYPEIDLRDSDYAEWVQVLFAKWEIAEGEEELFANLVMSQIEDHYDISIRTDALQAGKYRAILNSWFQVD